MRVLLVFPFRASPTYAPLGVADLPVPREAGQRVDVPAAIAEPDCTIWVAGGWRAEVGTLGAWVLRRSGAGR